MLAALVLTPALAACSQAARQHEADALRRSIPHAAGSGVSGSLTMTIRPPKLPQGAPAMTFGGVARTPPVAFVADPAHRVSSLLTKAGDPPVLLATDKSLYARRITAVVNERRPWIRVDLARVNDSEVPTAEQLGASSALGWPVVASPQLMIDMLAGVLTGSLKGGQPAADRSRSYRFNVSVDKANRELRLPDKRRDERTNVLRSLAITGDVFRGDAKVRGDGTLERLRVFFHQQPDKQTTIELAVAMTLDQTSAPDPSLLAIPVRKTTIRVSAVPAITAALSQRLALAFRPAVAS